MDELEQHWNTLLRTARAAAWLNADGERRRLAAETVGLRATEVAEESG
jgi:hypothetical protein